MAIRFVVLAALMAVAHCSVVPVVQVDTDSSSFSYDVADPNTGDYKSQVETRVGGNVVGQYSLLDADGTKRIVDYTADDINGFNAILRENSAIISAPVVATIPQVIAPQLVADNPSIVDAHRLVSPFVYSAVTEPPVHSVGHSVYAASVPFGTPLIYSAYW